MTTSWDDLRDRAAQLDDAVLDGAINEWRVGVSKACDLIILMAERGKMLEEDIMRLRGEI